MRLDRIERIFIGCRPHIKYLQLAMLMVFLWLAIFPIYAHNPLYKDTIFTSSVLLSQFLFWGVWYGLCLFSVIPFGRLWCGTLCPLGAVSQWSGKHGLSLNVPNWMKWNGWLFIMFVVVTILGQTLDVRDDPVGLAKLFGYMFFLAVLVGFIFGKKNSRPWCRYYCPIGKILGVVSRLSIIDFKPNKLDFKASLKQKQYIEGRRCPTDYNLPFKRSTNNCIACGACVFGKKKAGLGIYYRNPGDETQYILQRDPNWSEVFFILFSPGLCAGGFLWLILHQYQLFHDKLGTWLLSHNDMWAFQTATSWLSSQAWNQHYNWLDLMTICIYMLSYSFVVGLLLYGLIALSSWVIRSGKTRFRDVFLSLTYQFSPIAILSIVIGLCSKFFEVMNHDFGMSLATAGFIKLFLLLISMLWTLQLTWKQIRRINKTSKIRPIIAISIMSICVAFILYMWWPAIFGHNYMSVVEKIRQHIIVPG